jgi:Uma2 family endonuclease
MSALTENVLPNPLLTLDFSSAKLTDEQFYQLCIKNPEKKLEFAEGILIVMSPVGGKSGQEESRLNAEVFVWNKQTKLGVVFSSSTIFKLPNGNQRSPDVAFVERSRWEALTEEQQTKFPPLAPDFVIELRSPSDNLSELQAKMLDYRANGVRLGWLINPQNQKVEIYRPNCPTEVFQIPVVLSGEDVLPNFTLELDQY